MVSGDGQDFGKQPRTQALILADAPIYVVAVVLLGLCLAIFASNGISIRPVLIMANARLYAVSGFAIAVADTTWLLWRNKPLAPTALLMRVCRQRLDNPAVRARLPLFAIADNFIP